MPVPTLRAALIAAGAVLAFGAGAAPAQSKTLDLVVLGDSYASGVGATGASGTCMRSNYAWGPVYASKLRARGTTVNFKTAACGGAVVEDLDQQINAITPETDLVLMTIGGNDVGFIEIVLRCFIPVAADPAACRQKVTAATKNAPGVAAKVKARTEAIRAKLRPGAKVGVLSYPYLANPQKYVLRSLTASYEAGTPVRALGDVGDQQIISTSAAINAEAGYDLATYIPTKDLFATHEPNQDPFKENPLRWVNEITSPSPVGLYHPNNAGYRAMADAVLRAGGPEGDFGVSR